MNILAIGDIVTSNGCNFLRDKLPKLKATKYIDIVIANGENSADGNGITPFSAKHIFSSGVDVITTGNHTFRRKEIYEFLDKYPGIIRPANFPSVAPGKGYYIYDKGNIQICIINIMGLVYMDCLACPFETIDSILEIDEVKRCKIKILDFHAEATAEKKALGFYLDGRVSAIFGTHTHVQTSDETILPNKTGYITDVGMTGAIESVLGVKPESSIKKMKDKLPVRFEFAKGPCEMDCILFNIDESTGYTKSIERLRII